VAGLRGDGDYLSWYCWGHEETLDEAVLVLLAPSAAAAELRPALTRTFPGVAFAVARIIGAPALRRWAF
jgi:hypothetical protein